MTSLPFFQVDAFADRAFTGNPAAVMPLDAWLDDAVMQAIAAENNLSETAFLLPTPAGEADYALRWFTPVAEADMCGHATLASGHVVLGDDPGKAAVRFSTVKAGVLEVARAGEGYALSLPAWAPSPKPLDEIVVALGVDDVVATLWHERRYGVVVLADEAAVRACRPDFAQLKLSGDWLTIVTAPGDGTDIVSRVFAPGAGIDEDPVTGSAHAVLVPYWAERLGCDRLTAFQASRRGGRLDCALDGGRVILGGQCVTVIEGRFAL